MTYRVSLLMLAVVVYIAAGIALAHPAEARCYSAEMKALAQEHANDMARRNSLDHSGFQSRGRRGATAENVAYGCATEACVMRMWMRSPGHRANLALPGCHGIASAVSRSGKRYWALLIQ